MTLAHRSFVPLDTLGTKARRRPPTPRTRGALALVCWGFWQLACASEPAPEVPSAEAQRGRVERVVIATGTVEPATEVEVRPRIPGIVERIHVAEGDRVEVGALLVEIERELLASQVREAEAALEQAAVELRYARIDLEREKKMQESGAASDQKLDAARARTATARAARARAQAGLDTLSTQLGYASLHSTLVGRVLEVHVEEGDAVSPVTSVNGGSLMLSLAGDDVLHLEGLVDENEIARVALGQPARIRTEAFGDRVFEGVVSEIAPLGRRVQNVTYFEVEIEITDPEAALLRPRMSGDAEIVTEVVANAVVVPDTALRYRGDEVYVELAPPEGEGDDGEAPDERVVVVGIVDGDRVQITDGVEPGERVRLQ